LTRAAESGAAAVGTSTITEERQWTERFAERTLGVKSSVIRELLKLTEQPDILSFAGGLPAPEVFPIARLQEATQRVLAERGQAALQYGTTEGYLPLREMLVRHMARYGIEVTPDNVLVTAGAQQGLDLIGKLFLNPGDIVLTEEPTYLGAIQAFTAYQAQYLTVPIDDEGLVTSDLEVALQAGPKFLYVLPNFQNPGGTTLSRQRRERLVELASHYGVPIVEDDPYGQLRYEGQHLPPLAKIAADLEGGAANPRGLRSGVLYLGTLSKVLAPGLRIGWVVGPSVVIDKLVKLKQGADLHTSTFTQMVAHEAVRGGFLDRHIPLIRQVYGERMRAMLGALERHFPPSVRWTRPQGGLFLWVTLPTGLDSERLLQEARLAKVAFVPGRPFFANGGGASSLRLNFSYCTPERIEEGVRRLGRLIQASG
jgi:2-aminoadipate transaminase